MLKIAVVGTGNVARANYIPFLAAQPDVEMGFYNRTRDKAAAVAAEFGGKLFSSIDELAAWEPDAALVLTAETTRFEAGTALIEAGVRRLFFEKPLVAAKGQAHVTEEDFFNARSMLAAAKLASCETAMVFNYRFFEQSITARETAAARDFGKVINATGLVHYACWSHCIDLLQHFAGGATEIVALEGSLDHTAALLEITARDVTAAMKMESGATATLIGTAGMAWQHPLYEMTFTFERGRVHMRDLDGTLEILDAARQTHECISLSRHNSRWDQYAESFKKALGAYLDSLRDGAAPPVSGIDGLRELQVEAALKRSISERRPVKVQEEFKLAPAV